MSRKIKFRAWDSERKHYWFRVHEIGTGGRPEFDRFDDYLSDGNFIVEQYTGLKDKNGVEIYEGDMVKLPKGFNWPKVMLVEFDYSCAGFQPFVNGCGDCHQPEANECEVIGNIHENPELLEGKK